MRLAAAAKRIPYSYLSWLQSLLCLCLCLCLPKGSVYALKGDLWCGDLMCVQATVDDNTSVITYNLESLNQLGWMAIGFGPHMANTEMVILWPNPDGSATLSQRQASGHVEPTPIASPSRPASLSTVSNSSDPTAAPTLAFTIALQNDTIQNLIWAFATTTPPPDPSATLEQHLDAGNFTLDLTKDLDDGGSSSSSSSSNLNAPSPTSGSAPATTTTTTSSTSSTPLEAYEKLIIAHAVLGSFGFLFLLPLAILVARWGRSFTTRWFKIHWYVNVVLGVPVITVGWTMGVLAVAEQGHQHMRDLHQVCGVLLFVLYLLQLFLGVFIHWRRSIYGNTAHPPRNIMHIILGMVIMGLAFLQTRTGITHEWKAATHRPDLPASIPALWTAWMIILPIAYLLGYTLLPRQLAQEKLGMVVPTDSNPFDDPSPSASVRSPHSNGTLRSGIRFLSAAQIDDGTHDVYSIQATQSESATSRAQISDRSSSPQFTSIEMRELQSMMPVSLQPHFHLP